MEYDRCSILITEICSFLLDVHKEDTKLVDYEEIEEKCKTIRQNNIKLLEDFDAWLKVKRLTDHGEFTNPVYTMKYFP